MPLQTRCKTCYAYECRSDTPAERLYIRQGGTCLWGITFSSVTRTKIGTSSKRIAIKLKERGVPIWLDEWDIPHGANWNETRDNALYDAAQCLVILSSAAVNSQQVQAEWVTALEEKKPLVPILYQTCRIPSRLRLIQRFDFTSGGLENEEILEALLRALGGQQEPSGSQAKKVS